MVSEDNLLLDVDNHMDLQHLDKTSNSHQDLQQEDTTERGVFSPNTGDVQCLQTPGVLGMLKRKPTEQDSSTDEGSTSEIHDDDQRRRKLGGRVHRRRKQRKDMKYVEEKRKNILAKTLESNERRPINMLQAKILLNKGSYKEALHRLPTEKLSNEQMQRLCNTKRFGPNFLGRVASLGNGNRFGLSLCTNGHTTQYVLMPAADTQKDMKMHDQLLDMTQGELCYMLGMHLMWKNSP